MMTPTEAAAALDLPAEKMRERAAAYLVEQAEKFRVLKELAAEGMDDVASERVLEWNLQDFLAEARKPR